MRIVMNTSSNGRSMMLATTFSSSPRRVKSGYPENGESWKATSTESWSIGKRSEIFHFSFIPLYFFKYFLYASINCWRRSGVTNWHAIRKPSLLPCARSLRLQDLATSTARTLPSSISSTPRSSSRVSSTRCSRSSAHTRARKRESGFWNNSDRRVESVLD